ncbi:TonB-dependent receptor plug domain-containing protein [Winogradskyella sp. 3972H.M.0a.05]|uniref:TonB-dependent receptor plug domain-containing protein n=1 Tax=Winogradskyella sp. 3972H.M.0a.05 TaxID=2950277 RepID=UPI0033985BAC
MRTLITLIALLTVCNSKAQTTEFVLNIDNIDTQLFLEEDCVDYRYYYKVLNKANSAGAVVELTPEDIGQRPIVNIAELLEGRVAGLNVNSVFGQLRGLTSISIRGSMGNPLILLDGIPIQQDTLWALNPNDVDTISVLKDAGSTAVYGIRGGNGVIVITTKRI